MSSGDSTTRPASNDPPTNPTSFTRRVSVSTTTGTGSSSSSVYVNTSSQPTITANVRVGVTATIRTSGPNGANINPQQVPPPTNNNAGEIPQQTQNLFHMRDRLFLALFFRVTLIYARAFPKTLRRVLEFCLLMQSILLLFILGYIHVAYTRTPITCLSEHRNTWPRDGILRVEITTEPPEDYNVDKSYEKEEKLRQRAAASQMGHYSDDLFGMMLAADTWIFFDPRLILDRVVSTAGEMMSTLAKMKKPFGAKEVVEGPKQEPDPGEEGAEKTITKKTGSPITEINVGENEDSGGESSPISGSEQIDDELSDDEQAEIPVKKTEDLDSAIKNKSLEMDEDVMATGGGEGDDKTISEADALNPTFVNTASGEGSVIEKMDFDTIPESMYFNKTLEEIEVLKMKQKQMEDDKILKSSVSDFEMFANSGNTSAVWLHDQAYIVEYALEYGFLRLTPETRQRLNIPVKIVTLDPIKGQCFGDSFSRFLLDNFLGYDDILMSSIKNLAESEDNKGYLRNVVTGEQFRFVPMWMARSSYIPALLIMLVFTVSISMLLRYSHHQIFIFIVDLLNNIEGAGAIHIPAAPLFTVILALVGMEAIMSEFFNDTSTAFYVILIVWIADQFDSVCSHTNITKTYWVRFFYLYHFAFYAYHYRFNGQYGGLALLVSWSFIQHSMVYFYHHYELPAILRQAHQTDTPNQHNTNPSPAHQAPQPENTNRGTNSPEEQVAAPTITRTRETSAGGGTNVRTVPLAGTSAPVNSSGSGYRAFPSVILQSPQVTHLVHSNVNDSSSISARNSSDVRDSSIVNASGQPIFGSIRSAAENLTSTLSDLLSPPLSSTSTPNFRYRRNASQPAGQGDGPASTSSGNLSDDELD